MRALQGARSTVQLEERDLLCSMFCAIRGWYSTNWRDNRFGGDGVEGFIEVVFRSKSNVKASMKRT
jgi:hypothetical protein